MMLEHQKREWFDSTRGTLLVSDKVSKFHPILATQRVNTYMNNMYSQNQFCKWSVEDAGHRSVFESC